MDLKKRLNMIIEKDKENNPKYLSEVIKSDVFYLLNNYFEVDFNDIEIDIKINEKGKYQLKIESNCDRVKLMKVLPN